MGRRLGVMGGTFDPIHYGHLVTAEDALEQFELEGVLFVPTGRPWMKEHEVVSPAEDRYLMTVIATASNPLFSVSRIGVDRDGPTYTVETLRSLKGELDADLHFITGADAILEMIQWKQAAELFELARFIAATHPGYDMAGFEVPGTVGHVTDRTAPGPGSGGQQPLHERLELHRVAHLDHLDDVGVGRGGAVTRPPVGLRLGVEPVGVPRALHQRAQRRQGRRAVVVARVAQHEQ